jgi:hypothetical protein
MRKNKMNQKNTSKATITLIIAALALVIITLAVYFATAQTIELGEIAIFAVIGLIILFAIYVLYDKTKNMTKGLPAADERTKINTYKAGYYGFIAALWSAVFTPIVIDILFNYEIETHYLSGTVVIVAGLVFFISYLVISRKGKY